MTIPLILENGTASYQIPYASALSLEQTYEPVNTGDIVRMANGTAIKTVRWRKTATRISGEGWIPDGLAAISTNEWNSPFVLHCIAPRSITRLASITNPNVFTLPAARRTDSLAVPLGYAQISDGQHVRTPLTVATNIATLTTVSGAVLYAVSYWPTLCVFCEPPRERYDLSGAVAGWELTAEEI